MCVSTSLFFCCQKNNPFCKCYIFLTISFLSHGIYLVFMSLSYDVAVILFCMGLFIKGFVEYSIWLSLIIFRYCYVVGLGYSLEYILWWCSSYMVPPHSLFQIPLNKRTINFYCFYYTSFIKYSQQFGYVMILKNQWGNLKWYHTSHFMKRCTARIWQSTRLFLNTDFPPRRYTGWNIPSRLTQLLWTRCAKSFNAPCRTYWNMCRRKIYEQGSRRIQVTCPAYFLSAYLRFKEHDNVGILHAKKFLSPFSNHTKKFVIW